MNKKEYETPVIKELGSLRDMTRGFSNGDNEDNNYPEADFPDIWGS